MLTMVTNPGLHRGSCASCTAEYRANVEHFLNEAWWGSRYSGRSIDYQLDQRFEKFHAADHEWALV